MKEKIIMIGKWEILIVDRYTKKIIGKRVFENTIVNTGLDRMADLLFNENSTYFRAIAIGTGAVAVTNSDVELGTEYTRATATRSNPGSYQTKLSKTFTFGSGTSEDITEAGVFDSDTVSGSTMLNRKTFTAIAITSDIELITNVTITLSRP